MTNAISDRPSRLPLQRPSPSRSSLVTQPPQSLIMFTVSVPLPTQIALSDILPDELSTYVKILTIFE